MAKLGSFFRRLLTSLTSDNDCSSSSTTTSTTFPDAHKTIVVTPPLTAPVSTVTRKTIIKKSTHLPIQASQSCSTSPCIESKKITIELNNNTSTHTNLNLSSSSNNPKSFSRRLSAPLIIRSSTLRNRQHRSTVMDRSTEQALISPLQRLSLSSTTGTSAYHNNSVNSLGASGVSVNGSPHNDAHSSSLNLSLSNSSLLPSSLNHLSSTSGTPPTQYAVGASSSSPRASVQSNNSASPKSDRNMSAQSRGRRPSMFDPIDPKELQQALYSSAAAKANLVSNPSNEDESTRPLSHITISYDRDSQHVSIDTLSFENLHMLDGYVNTNSDFTTFYCRFRLLPEKRSLFQTKLVRLLRSQSAYVFDKKQLNEFELSYDQFNNHTVEMFLYKISSVKPLYRDVRIATVKFDLCDLSSLEQSRLKKALDECDALSIAQDPDLGELLMSLSYLQFAAKLSVVIIEAKNLRALSVENKPYPDACVKVTLYDRNGKKLKRKKTSVQRATDCPTFNEELVFELRRDIASEVMIEVRIVHESLSYKEQLGSITFGPIMNHTTKGPISLENVYWSTVLSGQSLNAQWHILKPSAKIDN